MEATEQKPTSKMTAAELRDEIHAWEAANGIEPSVVSGKLTELRSRVAELRAKESDDPEALGDVARHLPAVIEHEAIVARSEISVEEVVGQRDKIAQVMKLVMKEGVHYGEIPGVKKPTLLKPGAEVLAVTFRLAPSYESERTFHTPTAHLTVVSKVKLTHIPTGLVVAEGEGLCSSMEKKYAYRGTEGRKCPNCESPHILRSKFPPRESDYEGASRDDPPGWFCYAKKGGCGANFRHDDPRIAEQDDPTAKVENPDLPDVWNTVLKMANKRALVAAILNGTAASDIFTQDVEDQPAAADATEKRTDGKKPATQAKSYAEWEHRMNDIGVYSPEEWARQATEAIGGKEGNNIMQRLNRVLLTLSDGEPLDDGQFPPPDPDEVAAKIRDAFSQAFEGVVVDGPKPVPGDEIPFGETSSREDLVPTPGE